MVSMQNEYPSLTVQRHARNCALRLAEQSGHGQALFNSLMQRLLAGDSDAPLKALQTLLVGKNLNLAPQLGATVAEECNAGVHGLGAGQYLPQPTQADGTGASMRVQKGPYGLCIRPDGPRNEAMNASFRHLLFVRRPNWRFDGGCSA